MDSTRQNPQFQQGTAPGPLAKLAAFTLSVAFMVLAFMFSLVALAVVAVGGLLLWGWLWWKTRAIRQQIREQSAAQGPMTTDFNDGQIIEGEVIRESHPRKPCQQAAPV